MNAALSTDGYTITQSALSIRLCGMSSGMSMISCSTFPAFSIRSSSLLLSSARTPVGLTIVGSPISAAISRADRIVFIGCILLWVMDRHHMDFVHKPQPFDESRATGGRCHIIRCFPDYLLSHGFFQE